MLCPAAYVNEYLVAAGTGTLRHFWVGSGKAED